MSSTETLSLATRAMEAFNTADWETMRELAHKDVVYLEAGSARRIEGIGPYIDVLAEWKTALPDVSGTVRQAIAGGDLVAQNVVWRGTHEGPLPTPTGAIPPSGREVEVSASLWITSRDGRMAEVEHHLDVLSLLGQIGAL